ncbi:MAG: SDR family oxidoreductase [Nocardioides sp.]|uniref:SDR family oxidoreductase n=1 Tax=Nocardioides sp. TaxID=35761 RepID=UPI0039E26F29
MRVFVTGSSGWIGSAVVDELLAHGHQVLGLVRSDAAAEVVAANGADVLRGDLDDLDSLRRGAAQTDGTIHLANKHDWSDPAASNRAERASIEALAETLAGTGRPLVVSSGVAGLAPGRPATENDANPSVGPDAPRGGGENRAFDFAGQGVRAIAARFAPTVHGIGDHGFVALIAQAARRTGVSAYVGDGEHAWAAVHRGDAARLVRLGLESAPAGTRLHAVGEEAIPTRLIAEAIGERLGLPVAAIAPDEAIGHFGFVGRFFAMDLSASSAITRAALGWAPGGPTLLEDIAAGGYDPA